MASTSQKKSTSGRVGGRSGGSRSAKKAPQKQPVRREVAGGALLVLALFVFVSYFGVNALFLDFFAKLLRGLFGWGYWLAGPSLLLAGLILVFHRGRPVQLRTTCALLLPLFLGALAHLAFCKETYEPSFFKMLGIIWADGVALKSGGAVSGVLANGCAAVFSPLASTILFAALFAALLFLSLRLTLASLAQWQRARPRYEEPPEPAPRPVPPEPPRRRSAAGAAKPQIDIPLDGEERPVRPERSGKFTGFFRHKADAQPTPDQVLRAQTEADPVPAPPPEPAEKPKAAIPTPPPVPVPEPAPPEVPSGPEPVPLEPLREEPVPPVPEPEPVREAEPPQPEKPTAETFTRSGKAETAREVAAQTAAVAAEIEEKLASEDGSYLYPPVDLLKMSAGENHVEAGAELRNNSRRLAETLTSFGVDAAPGDVIHGPAVTRYEFVLEQGVKLSKITNLADDIALALGATGVRIAPIPDKISVVGVEVPNKQVTPVLIRDVIESREFAGHKSNVAFALGRDIGGRNVIGDIGTLPHVLIAGTTGSGKSVCTNSLIISLLYKSTPEDVRFIMVDPKMVELAPYNGIPHLLIPVVTDPKKAAGALQWAVFEMMKRYKTFSEHGVKKLEEFNRLAKTKEDLEPLPSVVVVIDELADLMLVAAKEVEESICRVAQMGRAAGMHLVIATQRPSADVITGLMKANIPSRIAFAVASSMESRIILDNGGAEKLVGRGDMLYAPLGAGKPTRVQGCFITPEEIDRVVSFVKQTGEAQYDDDVIAKIEESVQEKGSKGGKPASPDPQESEEDELLPAAVEVILETGQASTSMLQRRLKLGYSRAARLVDQLEERGYVGPFEGSKPRQLLITKEKWQEIKMGGGAPEEPPEESFGDE
nr:DNA translocase FtsK [uncultured Oscillibacter sp.]